MATQAGAAKSNQTRASAKQSGIGSLKRTRRCGRSRAGSISLQETHCSLAAFWRGRAFCFSPRDARLGAPKLESPRSPELEPEKDVALTTNLTTKKMKQNSRRTAGRLTVALALTMTTGLTMATGLMAVSASAQSPAPGPSQTPSTSQSSSQTPAAAPPIAPGATAAPGTVAITKANAEALAAYTGPDYLNRWEVYGGLNLMNGQAGQNLQHRYNMGGAEVMGTYWLGGPGAGILSHLGVAGDYRFGAGTTPVLSTAYNRVVIMQSIVSGGLQYRGPKNRYAAIDLHALAGGSTGIFDYAVNHYPGGSPVSSCPTNEVAPQTTNLGLYCNHTAPWGAAGGSVEFNESAKLAIRLQPDIVFEHFGTETREFFAISLGAVYRFEPKKKK
jgi:hypothetical protein